MRDKLSSQVFFDQFHQKSIYFKKGYEIWKNLPLKSPNYIIRLFDESTFCGNELIFVNKKRTKEEIERHLVLFKYVLGPKMDAETFVQSLEMISTPFYPFVKNDRVLLGILLGYGTENALKGSRQDYIDESLWDHKQILPLRSGEIMAKLKQVKKQPEMEESVFYRLNSGGLPSFSFSTLLEERQWLHKNHKLSSNKHSPLKKCAFPWFGYWDSEESEKILNSYLQTQEKLDELLQSDHFLEKIFAQLFGE